MRFALLLLLLAACGSDGFSGTFTGTHYQGQPATVELEQEGDRLTGTVRWAGTESVVTGSVEGEVAKGTVRHVASGIVVAFEATLREDSIDWVYLIDNPATGGTERLPITLRRGEATAAPTAAAGGIDPNLVGRWWTDVGGRNAGGTVTTRIYCHLRADGTYTYGGAQSAINVPTDPGRPGGPGHTGGAGAAGVVTGRWKAQDGTLYSKPEGAAAWIPLGQYTLSGSDLLLTSTGTKQLWSR